MRTILTAFQGTLDDDPGARRYSLRTMVHYGLLACIAGYFLFIFIFWGLGVPSMALFNAAGCCVFVAAYWFNRRAHPHLALLIGVFEVITHAAIAVVFLGWDCNFHFYLLGLIPLIFYSRVWRLGVKATLAGLLCLVYAALYAYSMVEPPLFPVTPFTIHVLSLINIAVLFAVFAVLSHYYVSATRFAENALKDANRKLESLAHTDPLTEISNRREMVKFIAAEADRFLWSGNAFSIILCDIDQFKECNDSLGHEAGDAILVKTADLLRAGIRDQDRLARWGGEEFLVLLPDTGLQAAGQIAERLREGIAGTCIQAGGRDVYVTMTFGVAAYTSLFADARECIRRADQAMYAGKRKGKNCVVVDAG